MTEFEFISVLMSIVLGIGLSQLMRGFAQAVYEKDTAPLDATHMAWTGTIFLNIVLNWWVLFQWSAREVWTFGIFLSLIVWAVALYLPVVFLYPPRKRSEESWASVYENNRRWFLGSAATFGAMDMWITWLRGELLDPPIYLPFVGHYIVLWLFGVFVPRAGVQKFLAWYTFLTMSTWALVVRRFLA